MYLQHFNLQETPFGLTPDTQFYYDLPSHREAMNVLLIALHNGEGFIKITGPVGSGKTMLCRKLLNELEPPICTAYIPNPDLSGEDLRMAIADEMGIAIARNHTQSRLTRQLNNHLIKTAASGKRMVLIIDEAQSMSLSTLETLRLLTNLETEKQKLLQIVLFGQPELDQRLQQQAIRQLNQRITFSYRLRPLTRPEVHAYIGHRLTIAGSPQALFSNTATALLHCYSGGIPRLVNILAHKAMLAAYGKGLQKVDWRHVRLAKKDCSEQQSDRLTMNPRIGYWLILFLSLFLFSYQQSILTL